MQPEHLDTLPRNLRHAPTPTTSIAAAFDAVRSVDGGVRERVRTGRDARRHADEPSDRSRAIRRRCARWRAHRRAEGARGAARAHRSDRRYEHRRRRRRLLRLRHERRRARAAHREPRVGDGVPERDAAAAQIVPPQARRRLVPRQPKAWLERRRVRVAGRARAGPGHRHDHLARDPACVAGRRLRRARDPVPRRGRRPRDGRGRGARRRQPRACDSRQHVDSGGDVADRDRRALARRWRHREEPARGRRPRDGRRARDRRGHFDGLDVARHSALGARRHVAAHEPADARRHARGPPPAHGQRRLGLAAIRRRLGLRGLHANARDGSERLRRGHAAARGLRALRSQRAAVRRVHCGAHRSAHERVAGRRVRPAGQRSTRRRQRRRSAARRDQARRAARRRRRRTRHEHRVRPRLLPERALRPRQRRRPHRYRDRRSTSARGDRITCSSEWNSAPPTNPTRCSASRRAT